MYCAIEQGVVLSCRFAEWKVRRAPRVLQMAVVSQSSVKFGKKRVFLFGTTNFMTNTTEVATSKFRHITCTRIQNIWNLPLPVWSEQFCNFLVVSRWYVTGLPSLLVTVRNHFCQCHFGLAEYCMPQVTNGQFPERKV